jgi:hypothetical protein
MLKAVTVLSLCASVAAAQGSLSRPVFPEKRHFLVLGDAVGTAAGGPLGGTTLLQAMRASVVVSIARDHAIDLTAVRLQTFLPPAGQANDYEYGNPEGDALILSYAGLGRSRSRGIPNELVLGGGVIRRHTAEAGRTRDTWVARVGYDSDPFTRWVHADAGIGFHAYFMPTNTRSLLYVATLGLYFRIG